jgi:hypothetical protein
MPEPDADLMAQRYGTPSGARRAVLLGLVVLLVVAGLTWLAWAAWFHGTPAIRAEIASYDVPTDHEARARVELRLSADDVNGTCLLRATAPDHSTVGERNVAVSELAEAQGSWVSIRTERRATSVTLEGCREG